MLLGLGVARRLGADLLPGAGQALHRGPQRLEPRATGSGTVDRFLAGTEERLGGAAQRQALLGRETRGGPVLRKRRGRPRWTRPAVGGRERHRSLPEEEERAGSPELGDDRLRSGELDPQLPPSRRFEVDQSPAEELLPEPEEPRRGLLGGDRPRVDHRETPALPPHAHPQPGGPAWLPELELEPFGPRRPDLLQHPPGQHPVQGGGDVTQLERTERHAGLQKAKRPGESAEPFILHGGSESLLPLLPGRLPCCPLRRRLPLLCRLLPLRRHQNLRVGVRHSMPSEWR